MLLWISGSDGVDGEQQEGYPSSDRSWKSPNIKFSSMAPTLPARMSTAALVYHMLPSALQCTLLTWRRFGLVPDVQGMRVPARQLDGEDICTVISGHCTRFSVHHADAGFCGLCGLDVALELINKCISDVSIFRV